jgi:hypothetical protein
MNDAKYIGTDVHRESISVAALNFAGKIGWNVSSRSCHSVAIIRARSSGNVAASKFSI